MFQVQVQVQVQDSVGGTITRSYDGLDRVVSETTPQGTVSYTYDAAGRRLTMQAQVSYSHDDALVGRLRRRGRRPVLSGLLRSLVVSKMDSLATAASA
jgi:YD repeat-containing protein